MRRATGKPEATRVPSCRMHGDKMTSVSWSRCSKKTKNIGIRNNSLQTWVKSRRSTTSARNHNNYSKTWTKPRSSNFARILQKSNVLITIPLRKSGSLLAVAGEIWSTSRVLQQPRRLIATILQSLALSLRRILLEDESTAILNDKSCSSRQRRCLRKQHSQNTGTIQRFLHDDMQKKDTEIRWRSTILAKKKLCFTIASLLNDMIAQLHELNGYRTPNIGSFVWMLMGPKNPVRQRPEHVGALKQCLKLQDAHLAETEQTLIPIHPQHQQRQRQNQQFEWGENFDYYVDRKTGWRCHREPWWNPPAASSSSSSTSQWPTSQWQASWSTSSEKWWWCRFYLERIPENRRRV